MSDKKDQADADKGWLMLLALIFASALSDKEKEELFEMVERLMEDDERDLVQREKD